MMRQAHRALWSKSQQLCAAAIVVLMLAGCATRAAHDADPVGAVPHDFSVDVAILLGRAVEEQPEAHRRPLRIVLYPDGSLHSGADEPRGRVNWVPGLTRRLNRDQMAGVYALARQLALADPERGDPFINPSQIEPQRRELVFLLSLSANDSRWMFVRRHHVDDEPDAAVTRFVRHLAALAWETDLSPETPIVLPKRYDFGPDPYARYRR